MNNKETLQGYNSRLSDNNDTITNINSLLKRLPVGGEDLTEELTDYETNLTTQETSIRDIIEALEGKATGGNSDKIAPMSIDFKYYKGTEIKGLNNLDTTNMTLMNNMFRECSNIQGLDLSNFDTSNVTNMSYMFYICSKLIELDLSSFNTSKVTTMSDMFNNCASLKKLDIRNFTFDTITDTGNMFANIPTDCLIIVKDNTTKDKVLAIRNRLTNVKTVAELEG